MGSLCNFREKKYCPPKNVFFGFLPPTNEDKIKTLKKSFFRQKFCHFTNCIYYTFKSMIYNIIKRKLLKNSLLDVKTYFFSISLKNIEKRVIYAFSEKKIHYRNVRKKA